MVCELRLKGQVAVKEVGKGGKRTQPILFTIFQQYEPVLKTVDRTKSQTTRTDARCIKGFRINPDSSGSRANPKANISRRVDFVVPASHAVGYHFCNENLRTSAV